MSECAVASCGRQVKGRNWCSAHYTRWLTSGSVREDIPVRRNHTEGCSISGCARAHYARTWCFKHYTRWQHYGDPTKLLIGEKGLGTIDAAGYRYIVRRGHPLASPIRGSVYEHRVVLYDKIGPGQQLCHWCGCTIEWCTKPVSAANRSTFLATDHLDFNKLNNAPDNLVPSCIDCNLKRLPQSA